MPIKQMLGGKISLFFMLVLTALATGCVNMSTLQTARTVPDDEIEVVTGGGYYLSPILSDSSSSDQNNDTIELIGLPYIEVGGRIGMAEYLDLGLKVTIPGTIALDVKYQLVDVGGFAMAVGLGLGYLHYETTNNDIKTSNEIIDLMVPIYVSYHLNESFAIYGAPKYVMRLNITGDSDAAQLLGAGGGVRMGKEVGIYLEATYMVDLANTDFTMMQVSAATFF